MRYWDKVGDIGGEQLAEALVGKSIIEITKDNTIVLDDGTRVQLLDDAECCAWFDVVNIQRNLDLGDNRVVAVKEVESSLEGSSGTAFDLVVLSRVGELARVQIDGDFGTGYYLRSIAMRVYPPLFSDGQD